MASQLRDIITFFDAIGLYDVVLPFLLAFTIVFAIFEKTKVLGTEDGKPKKNLNAIAAFVIAFLVVASSRLVEIITTVSANMVVLLLLVVLFLLLVGSFYAEGEKSVFLEGGWKTLFMAIVFIGIILIFLDALGFLEDTLDFLKGGRNEVVGAIILLVVIVIFVGWIVKEPHAKEKK